MSAARRILHDVNTDGTRDFNGGLAPEVKRVRFAEIFDHYHDPSELAPSPPAPAEVQAAFREVFHESVRAGRVKLCLHPWFRRWALFERASDMGEGAWACFYICCEPPVGGKLPADLQTSDHRYEELRGMIGDYRLPTKRDFEQIIPLSDKQRSTVASRVALQNKHRDTVMRENKAYLADATTDMLEYNFRRFWAVANQEAGSGWKPWSNATIVPHKNPARWVEVQRNGYTVKVRRGSVAHESYDRAEAEKARAEIARLDDLERAAAKVAAQDELRRAARHALYESSKARRRM